MSQANHQFIILVSFFCSVSKIIYKSVWNFKFSIKFAKTLKSLNYDKWVSIEMKNGVMNSNVEAVKNSLEYIYNIYKLENK